MGTPVTEPPNPHDIQPPFTSPFNAQDSDEGTLANEYDHPEHVDSNDSQAFLGAFPSATRSKEEESRLEDDLAVLHAEREVSHSRSEATIEPGRSLSFHRSRSRPEPVDQFDVNTNPIHEKASAFRPPDHPTGRVAKTFKRIHESSFLVRYFCYIVPIVLIILVPLLLGALLFDTASVGGVRLMYFCVWLEICWLSLWAGRILAKSLPWPVGLISSIFTNNSKKWRDMCKQLEIPATLFFWMLAVLISFLPVMIHHHLEGGVEVRKWEAVVNKIIISLFVGACLNFVEKIIIQLIAISFHLRTYADRIDINKFQIGSLTKLYQYSKEKLALEDYEFEDHTPQGPGSGARTPMQVLNEAQKKTQSVFGKVGDAAGKVAGDFTGRAVTKSNHPRQLILLLLSSPNQSQVLARRLYRTFVQDGAETITPEDLRHAFDNDEEAESSFTMFDKDLNGDISMSELEAVCVDIGKERKSITASLKDLDSVVAKLDAVLSFFVLIATVLVLLSLISTSAAGVLTSAGSAVLALSWLFSTTAQEFLASCIFVLVKHPFDVGDRVTVYGNTGTNMKGDDYFVKEISLLYTEFKKLEGQIVQAPNSYLNTLFIMNMRRSGGLAEGVPLTVKFGTSLSQIDELRARLLEFVKAEKREYQPNILTEIREVIEAHSVNLNVVFFYKSNWQNELLRLQRRNKFICALMISMQDVGIEGPRRRIPGSKEDNPFYYAAVPRSSSPDPFVGSELTYNPAQETQQTQARSANYPDRTRSILRTSSARRARGESISQLSRRVDFSLGVKDVSSADIMADLSDINRPHDLRLRSSSRLIDSHEQSIEEDESEAQVESRGSNEAETDRPSFLRHRNSVGKGIKRSDSSASSNHSKSVLGRNRLFSRSKMHNEPLDEEEGFIHQARQNLPKPSPWQQGSNQWPSDRAGSRTNTPSSSQKIWRPAAQEDGTRPSIIGMQRPTLPENDSYMRSQPIGPSQTQHIEMHKFS